VESKLSSRLEPDTEERKLISESLW
jgi:hypothetical protein